MLTAAQKMARYKLAGHLIKNVTDDQYDHDFVYYRGRGDAWGHAQRAGLIRGDRILLEGKDSFAATGELLYVNAEHVFGEGFGMSVAARSAYPEGKPNRQQVIDRLLQSIN